MEAVNVAPTWPQYDLLSCPAKYPAFVAGFGAGKTEGLINWLLSRKLENPKVDVAYYAPTYDLINLIAWPRFIEKLVEWGYQVTPNRNERRLYIHGGYGSIIFRTMNDPANIIGYEVGDSAADELDTLPPKKASEVWGRIISRNRTDKNGALNRAAVGTTPEGFRFTYQKWGKAANDENHTLIRASTRSNRRNLPADYVDNLYLSYPEQQLQAYIDGQFVNLTSGNVYSSFDRELNGTVERIHPGETLHVGMDFNVNNMHAAVFVVRPDRTLSRGVKVLLLDEIAKGRDTPSMIDALKQRFPGHSIVIYPDASGDSKSSRGATESDFTLLRDAGFTVRSPASNPAIKDRVNSVNGLLFNARLERHLFVNVDQCPVSAEALEQQTWSAEGLPDKSAGLDHIVDAIGYYLHYRFPVKRAISQTIFVEGA